MPSTWSRTALVASVAVGFALSLACAGGPRIVWDDPAAPQPPPGQPLMVQPDGLQGQQVQPATTVQGQSGGAPLAVPAQGENVLTTQPPAQPQAVSRGELQVMTGANVVTVRMDGSPMPYEEWSGSFVAYGVRSGTHRLQVENMLGKTTATLSVGVSGNRRTQVRYKRKTLTKEGVVAATGQRTAAARQAQHERSMEDLNRALTGSVQIDGLMPQQARVWIDGGQAAWASNHQSFVVFGLSSGTHSIRVEAFGGVVYEGGIEVQTGQNHRCTPRNNMRGWELDCHWTQALSQ